jgi:hypothetical protein
LEQINTKSFSATRLVTLTSNGAEESIIQAETQNAKFFMENNFEGTHFES